MNLYRNYYAFGQVLIDKVAAMAGFSDKFSYDFEGEEHLRSMKDGGLLISAHIGNWEIAGNLLNRLDTRFNIVMFDEEHERIKEMLSEVMVNKNVNVIVLKDDLSHLIEIRNALNNKELIAIHGDRFVEGSKTVRMDFLGKNALFPEGPFYLAAKFNVDVSYVFAMKETNSHYHFYATPAKRYGESGQRKMTEAMIRPIMEDYLGALEKTLLKYPLQWFNYYRFWENED
jgi:predicted LPLAT superfamily acyltransferase